MRQFRPVSATVNRAILLLTLVIVPMSLLGIHLLIKSEFNEVRAIRATAEESIETGDELAQLLALHLDAETSVRGYVLTGDPDFLQPYSNAVPRRDALFANLLEGSDAQQQQELANLLVLSDARLDHARLNIVDVREGRADRARVRIAAGTGLELTNAIRSSIGELQAGEEARLSQLTSAGTGSRNNVEEWITALLAGVAIVLAVATYLISASTRQRRFALERIELLAERQRAMFDGAVDGMLWLDEEGRVLRMNPSISRMFDYPESAIVGQHNLMLMKHEYSLEESRSWLATVGEAGVDGAGKRQELTGRRADGTTFETEIAISRVESEGDGSARYIASIRDISDRKRAEQMKTEFVSTVSHELRTPLTSIGGSLGLVLGGATGPLEDKTRRLIGIAHDNCDRLIRLINDILDIEKIEWGKMEFDIRRMHVGPLVRRTIDAMAGFASKHDVRLVVSMPPWPQCIMGDPDRLDQLLTNLVSNAVKHSPPGGDVEIACTQQGGFARIEVLDRGSGVPQSFRERIFGKFAMADTSDSRTRGGTGLGLSIAREIATCHQGHIDFVDREGGGTVFYVDLPLAKEHAIAKVEEDAGLPLVLHLDDDADCLSVVASAFGGRARVVTAMTLRDARFIASKQPIDAAIVDIALGRETGLSFVEQLRGNDARLPIVLFTATDYAIHTHGADRLLVKSRVKVDDLVTAVLALVESREQEAA